MRKHGGGPAAGAVRRHASSGNAGRRQRAPHHADELASGEGGGQVGIRRERRPQPRAVVRQAVDQEAARIEGGCQGAYGVRPGGHGRLCAGILREGLAEAGGHGAEGIRREGVEPFQALANNLDNSLRASGAVKRGIGPIGQLGRLADQERVGF